MPSHFVFPYAAIENTNPETSGFQSTMRSKFARYPKPVLGRRPPPRKK